MNRFFVIMGIVDGWNVDAYLFIISYLEGAGLEELKVRDSNLLYRGNGKELCPERFYYYTLLPLKYMQGKYEVRF